MEKWLCEEGAGTLGPRYYSQPDPDGTLQKYYPKHEVEKCLKERANKNEPEPDVYIEPFLPEKKRDDKK